MRDSELTKPLAEKAVGILGKYLDGKMAGSDLVRVALASLQTHVKMKATEANDDSNRLGLAKMIYGDPKLREAYVKKSLPHMLIEERK